MGRASFVTTSLIANARLNQKCWEPAAEPGGHCLQDWASSKTWVLDVYAELYVYILVIALRLRTTIQMRFCEIRLQHNCRNGFAADKFWVCLVACSSFKRAFRRICHVQVAAHEWVLSLWPTWQVLWTIWGSSLVDKPWSCALRCVTFLTDRNFWKGDFGGKHFYFVLAWMNVMWILVSDNH